MDECYDNIVPTVKTFALRNHQTNWNSNEVVGVHNNLTYVVSGSLTYVVNSIPYTLCPGDIIYIPRGLLKKSFADENSNWSCYTFMFIFSYTDNSFYELPFPRVFHLGLDGQMLNFCKEFNSLWLEKKFGYKIEARGLFTLILHKLISYVMENKQNEISVKRLDKVKEYILNNYNKDLNINQLASIVNLNPVYFGAYFKRYTGQYLSDFINFIRINKAKDLLLTGEYRVNEVAYQCGFNDSLYFSKVFKKMTGVSPSSLLK